MKPEQMKVREVLLLLEERNIISDGERGRIWSDYWNSQYRETIIKRKEE